MGGPVFGSPPATIMSSPWRALQVGGRWWRASWAGMLVLWDVCTVFLCKAASGQGAAWLTTARCCSRFTTAQWEPRRSVGGCPAMLSLQKSVLSAAADAMFDPVAYIENHESDTQVGAVLNRSSASTKVDLGCWLLGCRSARRAAPCMTPARLAALQPSHHQSNRSFLQAWLFWNPATRALCIAFRGTEQDKWKVGGCSYGWVQLWVDGG